jgi:cell division protein FtsN
MASTPSTAEALPTRVASATPTAPTPRPAAATPATGGGSSPQATPAPAQPAPQRVASAQPTAVAAAPADAAPVSGFSVQLGVSTSESDAKATLQRLQQKFSELDGKPPLIRKAEVNGSTVYRVRVGPMAREDASSLCSKIQGQGGQCFVAKN